ncbi:hypothetical protein MUK70_10480 [Dyadobacter chenwenxiniae]|uniref:Uncharacterized protein n=1 Tax=Dyadobacter chenwenxiniae TaxID=2906456 RepID=A0A9X1PNE6_9BACT|nr:hypothetical protein [Dyadobacter chenwenxiniae]MCF0063209.1 hypothetical protein [Dyadobacter chenwenxiniae]UON85411.1 hypothetical protein MUK70_10480 [Dyadobacter chenwenxiniae]
MEKDKIEILLKKYWQAETTIEEEKLIKAFLSTQEANEAFTADKHWFGAIKDASNTGHGEVHFTVDQSSSKTLPLRYPIWFKIAATVIIVSGLTWAGVNYNQRVQYQNEALARKRAESSLMTMSNALNEAYQHLNKPTGLINKGQTENYPL